MRIKVKQLSILSFAFLRSQYIFEAHYRLTKCNDELSVIFVDQCRCAWSFHILNYGNCAIKSWISTIKMPLITFLNNFLNQSTTESANNPPLFRGNNQHGSDVHRGNFVWFEDDFGVGGSWALRTFSTENKTNYSYNRRY